MFNKLNGSIGMGIMLSGAAGISCVFAYNWGVALGLLQVGTQLEITVFMVTHIVPLVLMAVGFVVHCIETINFRKLLKEEFLAR